MYCFSKLFFSNVTKFVVRRRFLGAAEERAIFAVRFYSEEEVPMIKVERLKGRSILCVDGSDSLTFLQDLTTNDVKVLEDEKCLFTAFLNSKGKVIHDAIIYKPENKHQYLVECDASSLEALQVHMSMCRKSSRVSVRSVENELNIWAVYSPDGESVEEMDLGEDILVCVDPRITDLGLRILAPVGVNVCHKVLLQGYNLYKTPASHYKWLRYRLGVGEGSREIPYGRYSPSEANCDFLNGVSSKKSYFVGQEQSTRDKCSWGSEQRIMPIYFDKSTESYFPLNTPIEDMKRKRKTPIGFLRGCQDMVGIGLLKVARALEGETVRIGNTLAHCVRPSWWPPIK